MRAIWKGHIRFSLVTIPIRVYSALDTAETVSFNQLHKEDQGRVGYDKKCKKCGKSVAMEEIVKGFEYEKDRYVVLEPEDFEKVKLPSTRIIEMEGFVKKAEVHPALFDSPYFIGPDGEVASKAYSLLQKTLDESGKLGVGRVVLRDREDVVLLGPQENGLMMYKLRYPNELRNIKDVPQLNGMVTDKEQLKLAKTLVDSMTTSLSKIDLKDRYQEALKEIIQAKIEGKEIVTPKEEIRPVTDLMKALKLSIEQAKGEKMPMEKAKGKARKEKAVKKTTRARKQKQA